MFSKTLVIGLLGRAVPLAIMAVVALTLATLIATARAQGRTICLRAATTAQDANLCAARSWFDEGMAMVLGPKLSK